MGYNYKLDLSVFPFHCGLVLKGTISFILRATSIFERLQTLARRLLVYKVVTIWQYNISGVSIHFKDSKLFPINDQRTSVNICACTQSGTGYAVAVRLLKFEQRTEQFLMNIWTYQCILTMLFILEKWLAYPQNMITRALSDEKWLHAYSNSLHFAHYNSLASAQGLQVIGANFTEVREQHLP